MGNPASDYILSKSKFKTNSFSAQRAQSEDAKYAKFDLNFLILLCAAAVGRRLCFLCGLCV